MAYMFPKGSFTGWTWSWSSADAIIRSTDVQMGDALTLALGYLLIRRIDKRIIPMIKNIISAINLRMLKKGFGPGGN